MDSIKFNKVIKTLGNNPEKKKYHLKDGPIKLVKYFLYLLLWSPDLLKKGHHQQKTVACNKTRLIGAQEFN